MLQCTQAVETKGDYVIPIQVCEVCNVFKYLNLKIKTYTKDMAPLTKSAAITGVAFRKGTSQTKYVANQVPEKVLILKLSAIVQDRC